MVTKIKTERPDEAEINEMARQIMEQNRVKMNQAGLNPMGLGHHPGGEMVRVQMNQQGQLVRVQQNSHQQNMMSSYPHNNAGNGKKSQGGWAPLDEDSRKGRFGWTGIEKTFIPYIFKTSGSGVKKVTEKFISVRMMERKILYKFLNVLPTEVNNCLSITSYHVTDQEAKLLNEINFKHADLQFGTDPFSVSKDLVVKLSDAQQFYEYLDLCYKKLVLKRSQDSDRCGFFRINKESVVPYTAKDKIKYIPLFYLEGETEDLNLKADKVEGWDLAYLRFCCKVQGIRNELIAANSCRVVALEDIKGLFPSGTTFEDYWPAKCSLEPMKNRPAQQLSSSSTTGNWIQKPVSAQQQQQPSIPFNQRKEKSAPVSNTKNNQSATVLKNNPANHSQQQQIMAQQIVQSENTQIQENKERQN